MAIGPIPATAIWAYVDRYGLPEWTVDAIYSLDASWMEAEHEMMEARRKTKPAPSEKPPAAPWHEPGSEPVPRAARAPALTGA